MRDVYIGRQPIYGRSLDVVAYELLFRGGDVDHASFDEGDRATSQVILNAFTEIGLDRVVGERFAFLNLTRGFITGEYPLPLPHERVVLEVLENVPADEEVLEGLARLRASGYRIALDDFALAGHNRDLLDHADIVKVDCLGLGEAEIRRQVIELEPYAIELLAEKIETHEQFRVCRDLGFDLFQGYFLSRPNVIHERVLNANRINLLQLLAELQEPTTSFERVNELVSHDVALSYKLLRHINTAAYGLRRRIDSVRETLLYLGLDTVRSLSSLFLMAGVEDKPQELVRTAMFRGRMCELLARAAGGLDRHKAFTVGLFSNIDVIMDAPMDALLERLPLAPDLRAALLRREGPLGAILSSTLAYERGDWERVPCLELSRGRIKAAFLGAIEFVEEVDRDLRNLAA
jgi:EAL and modified HD-GYP domain-containing signal transduction protein